MANDKAAEVGNGQRAFWTLLFFMLVGPALGGLATAGLFSIGAVAGLAPEPFTGKPLAQVAPHIVPIAITGFVWSAIPAAFTGIAIFPMVLKTGTVSFFMA
ncbi:MAG: hypothetical protein AAFY64_02240, partial [Pseudomonadota bacterium]